MARGRPKRIERSTVLYVDLHIKNKIGAMRKCGETYNDVVQRIIIKYEKSKK